MGVCTVMLKANPMLLTRSSIHVKKLRKAALKPRLPGRAGYAVGCMGPRPPAALRRAMRLELHQPQPPTATTGTTYIIEMYQCIRHARTIGAKSSTRPPRMTGPCRAPRGRAAPPWTTRPRGVSPGLVRAARADAGGGPSAPGAGAAAAHEQDQQDATERNRDADDDQRQRRLGALGRPEQLPVDRALAAPH